MMKRLVLLILCLLLACPALAEEPTNLKYSRELKGLPGNLSWTVYTGPGEEYHVAADGKAKVSSNEGIYCYGRVEGTDWLLIHYFVSEGKSRVGYIRIDPVAYQETLADVDTLCFRNEIFTLQAKAELTDDPNLSKRTIGTVSGEVTLLAIKYSGDWAYVEGTLDKTGEPVRGFISYGALEGAGRQPDIPVSPVAGERFTVTAEYPLNLPDDALADGMNVYSLADGSYLIAYHCQDSSKLWMRVISEKGKKVWAKSVEELYLSQITVTQTGFICETFDNSECDSGMRYTYTCKGNKWKSEKVKWIDEPDRYYADNTANFTLLRYPFVEGGQPIVLELTNRANGMEGESAISASWVFLYELDGELLLVDEAVGGLTLRRFAADLTERTNHPVPEGISEPYDIQTADHARNAVYFFTGYGMDWQLWRLDRETLTFSDAPVTIAVPEACTIIALAANAAGTHDIILETEFGAYFCQINADGSLLLHQALPGQLAWVSPVTEGGFLLVCQDGEGEFILQYYMICEG